MAGGSRQAERSALIDGMLAVHIGLDQAGIDREALAADQPLGDAARHGRLEQLAQQIAVAEAAVPVLGEGRVVGHIAFQPEPAEPAIGEVQMHLLAQPPLGPDADAVADDQHPDHQLGIDRGPTGRAVERPQMLANARQVDEPVDRAQQMIRRNMPLQVEAVEQRLLRHRPLAHHPTVSACLRRHRINTLAPLQGRVFQQNRPNSSRSLTSARMADPDGTRHSRFDERSGSRAPQMPPFALTREMPESRLAALSIILKKAACRDATNLRT